MRKSSFQCFAQFRTSKADVRLLMFQHNKYVYDWSDWSDDGFQEYQDASNKTIHNKQNIKRQDQTWISE